MNIFRDNCSQRFFRKVSICGDTVGMTLNLNAIARSAFATVSQELTMVYDGVSGGINGGVTDAHRHALVDLALVVVCRIPILV